MAGRRPRRPRQGQRRRVVGGSTQRELLPGDRIKIDQTTKSREVDGKEFLLTSVTHQMRQVVRLSQGRFGALAYSNDFTCIPADTPFRPPRTTPVPRVEGPQTAIVIGKKAFTDGDKNDQEVMTDALLV